MLERNVTAIAVECLSEGLPGVRVASRVPSSRPARFVRVWAVPGRERSVSQYSALVTAQVYGDDADWAEETARACSALLKAAAGQRLDGWVPVQWAMRNAGPYEYPDPDDNDAFRYQIVFDWGIRRA